MKRFVAPVVSLFLLASAGEAKAQFRLDQVVVGIFPNGAVFLIRVNLTGQGFFTGAGMVFLPMNGLQDLRVDVGADIPGGGIILVGRTQTPQEPMAIFIDTSGNLVFLYFGVAYTGTGLIINQFF
jgi:hypothetical protein